MKKTMLILTGVLVVSGCRAVQSPRPAPEIEMVFVPGGTFDMGCTPEQGSDCSVIEEPAHQVTVNDFYIGKYEVTQAQWETVMESNLSEFQSTSSPLPVEQVSWNDVPEYVRRLNAKTGKVYRLPTDAEWEYAARGGAKSKGYKYSGGDNIAEVAWYHGNSGAKPHPVGQKAPNELGIYDMSGNVWEWCQGLYGDSDGSQTNPAEPSPRRFPVTRGGSWFSDALNVRVSYRSINTSDYRSDRIGLRLVLDSE
jgi:formylglycine-generating enzyme required for sulfatase activity